MPALYRSGRRADALQAYRDTRQVLVDEIGLEQSLELQQGGGLAVRAGSGLSSGRSRWVLIPNPVPRIQ